MPKVPNYNPVKRQRRPARNIIVDTARAWDIPVAEMYNIYDWLDRKVPEYRRWRALRTILQKRQAKLPPKKQPQNQDDDD